MGFLFLEDLVLYPYFCSPCFGRAAHKGEVDEWLKSVVC